MILLSRYHRWLMLLVCLCLMIPVPVVYGNTYYVSAGGNGDSPSDSNCTTVRNLSTPARHIQWVHDNCVAAGDTIYVRSGHYPETFQWTHFATNEAGRITISGYPGDSDPIVDPPDAPGLIWNLLNGPIGITPGYLTIQHMTFDGSHASSFWGVLSDRLCDECDARHYYHHQLSWQCHCG